MCDDVFPIDENIHDIPSMVLLCRQYYGSVLNKPVGTCPVTRNAGNTLA